MKEMNERQKAQHAESQMRLAKNQAHELEKRLEMVETKFSEVTRSNMELQRTERELRDQIVTSIPADEFNQLKKKTEVCMYCQLGLCKTKCQILMDEKKEPDSNGLLFASSL